MTKCVVCGRTRNIKSKENKISFHRLPKGESFRNKWKEFFIQNLLDINNVSINSFICSAHFDPKCFWQYERSKWLKQNSVPSIIIPRVFNSRKHYPESARFSTSITTSSVSSKPEIIKMLTKSIYFDGMSPLDEITFLPTSDITPSNILSESGSALKESVSPSTLDATFNNRLPESSSKFDIQKSSCQSEYKKPRIRPGAMPAIFENVQNKFENCPPNNICEDKSENIQFSRKEPLCVYSGQRHSQQISDQPENELEDFNTSVLATPSYHKLFVLIYNNDSIIKIPAGWTRSLTANKPDIVVYFQLLSKTNNNILSAEITPVFGKTVSVNFKGEVECSYLGKNCPIQLLLPDLENTSELTIEQLTSIIFSFHQKDVCEGVNVKEANVKFITDTVYIDTFNKWRHNNCSIVLSAENINVCNSCNSVAQLFRNKKCRRISRPRIKISFIKKDKLRFQKQSISEQAIDEINKIKQIFKPTNSLSALKSSQSERKN